MTTEKIEDDLCTMEQRCQEKEEIPLGSWVRFNEKFARKHQIPVDGVYQLISKKVAYVGVIYYYFAVPPQYGKQLSVLYAKHGGYTKEVPIAPKHLVCIEEERDNCVWNSEPVAALNPDFSKGDTVSLGGVSTVVDEIDFSSTEVPMVKVKTETEKAFYNPLLFQRVKGAEKAVRHTINAPEFIKKMTEERARDAFNIAAETEEFPGVTKAHKAAIRIGSRKLSKSSQAVLVGLLKKNGFNKSHIAATTHLFESEYGRAALSYLIGSLLERHSSMKTNIHVKLLVNELKVDAIAVTGENILDTVIDTFTPALITALEDNQTEIEQERLDSQNAGNSNAMNA